MGVLQAPERERAELPWKDGGSVFYVIGNFVPYYIKTLREDATGAHLRMQADACAHQRAKSLNAALCFYFVLDKRNSYAIIHIKLLGNIGISDSEP